MNPSQQNATDQTANFFWVLAMLIGAMLLIWFFRPGWIVQPVFWVRIHEIDLMKDIFAMWNMVANMLHLSPLSTDNLSKIQLYMQISNPHDVTFKMFSQINAYLGHWVRWPVTLVLLGISAFLYFRHGARLYHHSYNMNSLKKSEVENWPQIMPVLSLDLVKQDPDEGPWAMARLPLDFCKDQNLVQEAEQGGKKVWLLDKKAAHRVFALQLGKLWYGANALPIHAKALVVVFIARALREHQVAKHFLSQIARSAASGKLDFHGVDEQLQKYKDHRIIKWLEKRHAYAHTLMMTLLEIARSDGVLATSEFLWLKPVDRKLWYSVNSVGRQTAVIEVGGIFSHWLAEKKIGRALKNPMVKQAVTALEKSIEDTLYVDESEKWRTSNAA